MKVKRRKSTYPTEQGAFRRVLEMGLAADALARKGLGHIKMRAIAASFPIDSSIRSVITLKIRCESNRPAGIYTG